MIILRSFYLFLHQYVTNGNQTVKIYIYYILGMLAGLLCSLPAYSVDSASQHLKKLQILIKNNLPYDTGISSDSIIAWEKELEPQLEKSGQYDLLFHLKQLVARAYATRGDISVAVDRAHSMYEKAKKMEYDKGIALSLCAIGDVYLESNIQQQAVDSYEEALRILNKSNDNDLLKVHILPRLTLCLLKIGKIDEAALHIGQFDVLLDKFPTSSNV